MTTDPSKFESIEGAGPGWPTAAGDRDGRTDVASDGGAIEADLDHPRRQEGRRARWLWFAAVAGLLVLLPATVFLTLFALRQYHAAKHASAMVARQAYAAHLLAAEAAVASGAAPSAARHLSEAAGPLRGWEWNYLRNRIDPSLATFRGHEAPIEGLWFSPDGMRLATRTRLGVILWNAPDGTRIADLGDATTYTAIFSPAGDRLVTQAWKDDDIAYVTLCGAADGRPLAPLGRGTPVFDIDGTRIVTWRHDALHRVAPNPPKRDDDLSIWDASSGARLARLPLHNVTAMTFSPSGEMLAAGSANGAMLIWNVARMQQVASIAGHAGAVNAIGFNADGSRILTTSRMIYRGQTRVSETSPPDTIRLWGASSGMEIGLLDDADTPPVGGVFSPDGSKLVTCTMDGSLVIRSARSGRRLRELSGHDGEPSGMRFGRTGAQLVSAGPAGDRSVKLWSVETGELLTTITGHGARVDSVAFNGDDTRLVTWSQDNILKVWDAATGVELAAFGDAGVRMTAVAYDPDLSRIAAGTARGEVLLCETSSGQVVRRFGGLEQPVTSLAFEGERLAAGAADGTIKIWSLSPPAMTPEPVPGEKLLAFGRAGGTDVLIVSGMDSYGIRVRNTRTGETRVVLEGHEAPVTGASISGGRLASISWDGTARVWDVASGAQLLAREYAAEIDAVALHDEAGILAVATSDHVIHLCHTSSNQDELLPGHNGPIYALAFSPDGERLASGSWDGTARLWDVRSARPVSVVAKHESDVAAVAFDAAGRVIVSQSSGEIQLHEAGGHELMRITTDPDRPFTCMTLLPDGSRLMTGSESGAIVVWDVTVPGAPLELLALHRHDHPVAALCASADSTRVCSISTDGVVRWWDGRKRPEP